jgi:hypothetical protein
MFDHPVAKIAAFAAGLPILVCVCLFAVFVVVDTSRRRLGESGVSYRPIRARIADWLLIVKFWWKK